MDLSDNRITLHDITVDIPHKSVESVFPPNCCIYKVPEYVRKENEEAYTPRLISIGPIHYNNAKLNQMEKQKLVYLQYFLVRLSDWRKRDLEDYIAGLGDMEHSIRSCYSEYLDLDKNKFVRMIFLDTVFIMELFLRKWKGTKDDDLFKKSWIEKGIERDLLLVENQIPFFVLEELYKYVPETEERPHSSLYESETEERPHSSLYVTETEERPHSSLYVPETEERRHSSFLELACYYFKAYDFNPGPGMSLNKPTKDDKLKTGWDKPKHFTDLIRYFLVPLNLSYDDETAPIIKTATKLKGSGIIFEPISMGCLLDVKFKEIPIPIWLSHFSKIKYLKARLQIPKLIVDGSTEYILRNLMAFEQYHYPDHHYVCSYVALLDNLIHTKQDVNMLINSEVIVNELGMSDKDLVALINILCKKVIVKHNYYGSVARELDRHYRRWFNMILAPLRLVYFKDLWRGTETIMGILVLAFVVIYLYKAIKDLWFS